MYLRRRAELTPVTVVMSVLSVAMLAVATIGSIVPLPPPPLNYLPYIFLGLLALGVARFLYLRAKDPTVVKAIEADLVGEYAQ